MTTYESFQDIPQFPRSYYQLTGEWRYLESTIKLLSENGEGVDYNPPYQRGYVWTQEQKERYVEYCLRGGTSGRDIYFNMPNWKDDFSPAPTPWQATLELVDGKQRLDAVIGFMHGKVRAFGKTYEEFKGKLRSVHLVIHVGCLHTPLEVVDWYLGMNNGGTAHTEKDLKVALDYRRTLL